MKSSTEFGETLFWKMMTSEWSARLVFRDCSPCHYLSRRRGGAVLMGRSKPVELATRIFEKQGDATAFFKTMLSRYRAGEHVADQDSLDLVSLLERRTEYAAKVGCGVSHF
nr:DUF3223 domain-containing protein [Bradyrhizobium sp. 2S1]MCK7672565.1 DCL family protein [Bradyrhizobium sp. 2S1]